MQCKHDWKAVYTHKLIQKQENVPFTYIWADVSLSVLLRPSFGDGPALLKGGIKQKGKNISLDTYQTEIEPPSTHRETANAVIQTNSCFKNKAMNEPPSGEQPKRLK